MQRYHITEFDVRCGDITSGIDLNEPCTFDNCPDEHVVVLTQQQLIDIVFSQFSA